MAVGVWEDTIDIIVDAFVLSGYGTRRIINFKFSSGRLSRSKVVVDAYGQEESCREAKSWGAKHSSMAPLILISRIPRLSWRWLLSLWIQWEILPFRRSWCDRRSGQFCSRAKNVSDRCKTTRRTLLWKLSWLCAELTLGLVNTIPESFSLKENADALILSLGSWSTNGFMNIMSSKFVIPRTVLHGASGFSTWLVRNVQSQEFSKWYTYGRCSLKSKYILSHSQRNLFPGDHWIFKFTTICGT